MKKFNIFNRSLIFVVLFLTVGVSIAMVLVHKNNKEKAQEAALNFFYCADDGNAMQTCVSIASLLDNSGDEDINIHIVSFSDNKMSEDNMNKIEMLKETIRDFDLDFVYFDKSKLDEFDTDFWNKAIMVKLYAAEIFPNLKRIIWLDDDTIILKSLKDLYHTENINGKYLAGVDVSEEYNKHYDRDCDYWITAGIGLYNLEEMRKDNIQKSLLDSAKAYPKDGHADKKYCGGIEEYALTNGLPRDKVLVLPYEYSVMASLFKKEAYKDLDLSDCVMLHFAGSGKPWKSHDNMDKRFYEEWLYYFSKTGYYKG